MHRLLIAFLGLCTLSGTVSAFVLPEKPAGYVNDYAMILSEETRQGLEQELTLFAASTTNEITVVTVPDLGGVSIEEYAVKLFEAWKIGKEKQDNGVLLLVSLDDRKARIEVGYGLEGALPDITASDILNTKVLSEFKRGAYDLGVLQGVRAIMEVTLGEYLATPQGEGKKMTTTSFLFILFLGVQVVTFIASVLGRSKSWWVGGVLGGVLGICITAFNILEVPLFFNGLLTVVFVLLGLLFDYIVSRSYINAVASGASIPWWVGGGGGRFSSGGGSSFSGFGGGRSGGGGASGGW
jgi:uncharacterized protein